MESGRRGATVIQKKRRAISSLPDPDRNLPIPGGIGRFRSEFVLAGTLFYEFSVEIA